MLFGARFIFDFLPLRLCADAGRSSSNEELVISRQKIHCHIDLECVLHCSAIFNLTRGSAFIGHELLIIAVHNKRYASTS